MNYQRNLLEQHSKKRLERKLNRLKKSAEIEKYKKQVEEMLKKSYVQESNAFMRKLSR